MAWGIRSWQSLQHSISYWCISFHCLDLQLCSQKGYVCEGCHNNEVIYPFDIDTTYQVTIPRAQTFPMFSSAQT